MKNLEKLIPEANDNSCPQVIELNPASRGHKRRDPLREPGQVIEFKTITQRELSNDPELPPAA